MRHCDACRVAVDRSGDASLLRILVAATVGLNRGRRSPRHLLQLDASFAKTTRGCVAKSDFLTTAVPAEVWMMKCFRPTWFRQSRYSCCYCCRSQGVGGSLLERPGVLGDRPWPPEASAAGRVCHTKTRHMAPIEPACDAKAPRVKSYSGLLASPGTRRRKEKRQP